MRGLQSDQEAVAWLDADWTAHQSRRAGPTCRYRSTPAGEYGFTTPVLGLILLDRHGHRLRHERREEFSDSVEETFVDPAANADLDHVTFNHSVQGI